MSVNGLTIQSHTSRRILGEATTRLRLEGFARNGGFNQLKVDAELNGEFHGISGKSAICVEVNSFPHYARLMINKLLTPVNQFM